MIFHMHPLTYATARFCCFFACVFIWRFCTRFLLATE